MSDVKPRAFSLTRNDDDCITRQAPVRGVSAPLGYVCWAIWAVDNFTNMFEHVRASHASTRDRVKLHEWKVLLGVYQEPVNHIPATLNSCSA